MVIPEQDYIADGLTENIITGLSQISEMFVIARNSVFTFKGKPVKVKQVSEELGVKYVLEGSVQKSGDSLRVTAQLVDALKGHHLWSEKYDRKMENFFVFRTTLTFNTSSCTEIKLTEGEQARLRHSTGRSGSLGFGSESQRANRIIRSGKTTQRHESVFTKAVAFDPNYAYAWSYLGWTYWIDGVYYRAHYAAGSPLKAPKMAAEGLRVDNKSTGCPCFNGWCILLNRLEKNVKRKLLAKKLSSCDPNSSENHAIVAITMQNVGKFEEAIALAEQAMRLDPFSPVGILRGWSSYQMMGKYEESIAAFKKAVIGKA